MVHEHEPADQPFDRDFDADELAALLHGAYDVPEVRPGFLRELDERVSDAMGGLVASPSSNGHGQAGLVEATSDDTNQIPGKPDERTRRSLWRPLVLAGLAVSAMLAVLVWTSTPAYSWDRMLEALKRQPWVRLQADASQTRWFSSSNRVTVQTSPESVTLSNVGQGVQSTYDVQQGKLFRDPVDTDVSAIENPLAGLFATLDANGSVRNAIRRGEVLSENWQSIEVENMRLVKLDVQLKSDTGPVDLTFHLDPQTNLPVTWTVATAQNTAPQQFRLDYPKGGPADVFELGVPRDVDIVDRTVPAAPPEEDESIPPTPVTLPPPAPLAEISNRVDEMLSAAWQDNGVVPADLTSDAEFARRVYLDLAGRIPTAGEVRTFLEDGNLDRRERLIDELVTSYDHATHFASVWRQFMLPEGEDLSRFGGTQKFEQWLADRFRANASYDSVVGELLSVEGRVNEDGPVLFYTAWKLKPEELARGAARSLLGVRFDCAQCHDHPFNELKQEDFWQFAAFFAQLSQPKVTMDELSTVMLVRDSQDGEVHLPDTDEIVAPSFPGSESPAQIQGQSRREALSNWLTAADNPYFAQATVNRVWAHLFGRGLVDPVDDFGSHNPAKMPQLLDALSDHFVRSGYDLRELLTLLVRTRAYQLSSESVDGDADDDFLRKQVFAQMHVKSLTAGQLYDCIAVATMRETASTGPQQASSLARITNTSRIAFLQQFRAPGGRTTEYLSGIPQALTLMNGELIEDATSLASSGLLTSLTAPWLSNEQRLDLLYLSTLSRRPDTVERDELLPLIESESTPEGLAELTADILWALLNCAEFTLNH